MKHRKQIKHYHTPGELHEFTFSCYDSIPILTNDKWCELLARSLDDAGRAEQINLVAFVFMPEHVHLLVYRRRDEPDLPGYLAQMKRGFSDQLQQILSGQQSRLLTRLTVTERPGKDAFRCWEEGAGYDRNIFLEASDGGFHLLSPQQSGPARAVSAGRELEVVFGSVLLVESAAAAVY